jgi:WD40 repeat protein
VSAIAFAPDGLKLASSSADYTLRLWDIRSGEELLLLQGLERTTNVPWEELEAQRIYKDVISSPAKALDFAPDGLTLASAHIDGCVRLWNATSGALLRILKGHDRTPFIFRGHIVQAAVQALGYAPDGKILASGSFDKTVRLWNTDLSEAVLSAEGHPDEVVDMVIASGGQKMASTDGITVCRWDIGSLAMPRLINCSGQFMSFVTKMRFAPDNQSLAVAIHHLSGREYVRLWQDELGWRELRFEDNSSAEILLFTPDSRNVVLGRENGTVLVWDVGGGQILHVLKGHKKRVRALEFSADGRILASGSRDETICLWELESGTMLHKIWQSDLSPSIFAGDAGEILRLAFAPSGRTLASGSRDGTLRVWDIWLEVSQKETKVNRLFGAMHLGRIKPLVIIANACDSKRLHYSASESHVITTRGRFQIDALAPHPSLSEDHKDLSLEVKDGWITCTGLRVLHLPVDVACDTAWCWDGFLMLGPKNNDVLIKSRHMLEDSTTSIFRFDEAKLRRQIADRRAGLHQVFPRIEPSAYPSKKGSTSKQNSHDIRRNFDSRGRILGQANDIDARDSDDGGELRNFRTANRQVDPRLELSRAEHLRRARRDAHGDFGSNQ